MNDLWFWRQWPNPYRSLTALLLILASSLALLFIGFYLAEYVPALGWEVLSAGEWLPFPYQTLSPATHPHDLTLEALVVQQLFRGQTLVVEPWWAYAFMGLIIITLSIGQALISMLSRFWYFVGMTGVILLFFFFKLDLLQINLFNNRGGVILILAVYLPLSYFVHAIRPQTTLPTRIILFMVGSILLGFLLNYLSPVADITFFLSQYTATLPLVLILLFIVTIGHEPMAGLVFVATQSGGKQAVIHFITFTVIYLGYLFISYLHHTNALHWDILYLDGNLLLLVSSLLGIWGFRARRELAQKILPFRPVGSWLYLLLMIVTWGSLFYYWITANDPILETVEEVVFMSHMGFGVVFFLYVLSNFFTPMRLGNPVARVLYKPMRMPFYVFRFIGLIVAVASGFKSSNYPITRTSAGYYNGLGDAYTREGNLTLAQAYYLQGRMYSGVNHRSNYSLASLAIENQKTDAAIKHLLRGVGKNPLPQSFVNLSLLLKDDHQFFDAKFQLEDGLQRFPGNKPMLNNLGIFYYQTNILDSAAYYFNSSGGTYQNEEPSNTNLWAVLAKLNVNLPSDSVNTLVYSHTNAVDANIMAWRTQQGTTTEKPPTLPADSVLSQNEFGSVYNYTWNQLSDPDTTWLNTVYTLANHPANEAWWERLTYCLAIADIEALRIASADLGLNRLAMGIPAKAGYYYNLLGLLALKTQIPAKAAEYFARAVNARYPQANVNLAFALLEANQRDQCLTLLAEADSIPGVTPNQLNTLLALEQSLLWTPDQPGGLLNDQQRFWALRFAPSTWPTETLKSLWDRIQEADQKALAGIALIESRPDTFWPMLQGPLRSTPVSNREIAQAIAWTVLRHDPLVEVERLLQLDTKDLRHRIWQRVLNLQQQNWPMNDLLNSARELPFEPTLVKKAGESLFAQNDTLGGYLVAQQSVVFDPWSIRLAKNYALQSLRAGYSGIATETMEQLSKTMPSGEYHTFRSTFDSLQLLQIPVEFRQ